MPSEDSDDEPLSIIAAIKRRDHLEIEILPVTEAGTKETWSEEPCNVSISLQSSVEDTVVERPTDVWLYLKDFNSTGPYSCLLCPDWFVNKTKIIIHYVINHQKDYCPICRYFVPNREAWWAHLKFHTPWKCSLCSESFMSQSDLSEHFSSVHKLIQCRLCDLRLSGDELYNTHLYRKHGVTNVSNKYEDVFWDFEFEDNHKFICLLCTNSKMKKREGKRPFSDHFLGFHHFNLKCFMFLISGTDLPIKIQGVDLTPDFIETQLKEHGHYGYVEFEKAAVKQGDDNKIEPAKNEDTATIESIEEAKTPVTLDEEKLKMSEVASNYKGEEDFDVTLVELVLIQKCYYEYVYETLTFVNSCIMPLSSDIDYANAKLKDINCCFCDETSPNASSFTLHMSKMHVVKTLPTYTCRICATVFTSTVELRNHIYEEMRDFDNLWLCQFCDKEFKNRNETREHLTEHWNVLEYDNCFSPHLGFKCMYCPTLFWNETDREGHHVRVHFQRHRSNFYKCTDCDELFGDKVWFVHHYIDKHNKEDMQYLLKCCICCAVLRDGDQMRSHFNEHHPEATKIFCSLGSCKYKPFSHKKSFYLHIRSFHNPATRISRTTSCGTCGLEFTSGRALAAHFTQKHGSGRFKCTLCKDSLRTNDERKIHYLLAHPGQYYYKCPLCNKSFQYKSSLSIHKRDHAPNKKSYPCNFCGKVFMKKDSYREHMHIHRDPRFACSYCPMKFVQRSNMIRHERRHTGERPYSCRWCPRTFSDKGACTSHSRVHLKDKSFSCKFCGQNFVQKTKLNYHMRKHTGENLETCTVCSKKFTTATSLREHMKTHIRSKMKKTFKCPLCKLMYPDEKSLLRHMRARHTRARHPCPLCRRALCSGASLREHVLTHAKIKTFRCRLCPKAYHGKKPMVNHLQVYHGIKEKVINTVQHYRRLGPEECDLGLDEEVFNKIFRPSMRKKMIEVDIPEANRNQGKADEAENEQDTINKSSMIEIKIEPNDTEVVEPPTTFVKVKIECVNEQSEVNDAEMNDEYII